MAHHRVQVIKWSFYGNQYSPSVPLLRCRARVKCELRNCEWVFYELKCELARDWSAIFRRTRNSLERWSSAWDMKFNTKNDNSSGRSAIYRLPTRKLLAVDRIWIYGFVSLISVLTGNGNPLHIKSIIPVGKPTASIHTSPPKTRFALASYLHRQWSLLHGYRPLMRPTPLPRKISYIYIALCWTLFRCRFVMRMLLLLLGLGLKCGSLV